MIARPVRLFTRFAGAGEHDQQHRQREEIKPLVGIERHAGRRIGLQYHDPLHPTGQRFEGLEFEDLRHRRGERERCQSEVEALEAQGRQPEQEPDDKADRAGTGQGPIISEIQLLHQDRGGVSAYPVKGAVPQRELPVEAGQQIETQDRQAVDHHQGQLENKKALENKGDYQRHDDRRRNEELAGARLCDHESARRRACKGNCLPRRARHTRLTTVRPNTPLGLTISTATISTRAIVSFNSRPK